MKTNTASIIFPLKKEMATHSSVLAWRIPGTGKPGGLPWDFPGKSTGVGCHCLLRGICAEEANINNSQAGCTDQQV